MSSHTHVSAHTRIASTLCPVLAAALLLFAFPLKAENSLALIVATDGVSVTGVAPGETVVLFGVAREPHYSYSTVRRWTEVLPDTDRDGVVRLSASVSNKSIWIAVELGSGRTVAQTGADYPRRELAAGDVFKRNNVGQLSKFENARGWAELLVVRPGSGAWRTGAGKDSSLDENKGTPNALRIDASSFAPVAGAGAGRLEHLKRGDLVAMIDPNRMEFYVVTVGED